RRTFQICWRDSLESEIDAIDGIIESAVIGVPHPDFGEGVTAVVVKAGRVQLGEKELLDRLEASSSCRSKSSSWTNYPATPWAKFRRMCCGPITPRFTRRSHLQLVARYE